MASKRKSSNENGDGDESPTRAGGSKRQREGEETEEEFMKKLFPFDDFCREETPDEFMKKLEPGDRKVVQKLRQKYRFNVLHSSSRKCKYRLRFKNELPNTLYSETNFKVDNIVIEIVLVDASNNFITTGPMATAEIEIVVLNGDLNVDEHGEWTKEKFMNNILKPRKDKGPLFIGKLPTKLLNGIGRISDATFTDNSSWANQYKSFRLGVRGMAKEVQEGISNPFRVQDRRMKRNQNDRLLLMNDEVCCLTGISKNGIFHKRLIEKCNINTMWDFLEYCRINGPEMLRVMIGMKKGNWETTYGHASKSRELYAILLHGSFVNPPAPDQNFYELTGSSSSQPSNVQVQWQLPSYAEFELPISGMSASAQGLATPNFEPGNKTIFFTSVGIYNGTNRIDMSFEGLLEEVNGRSYVSNNFGSGSPLLRDKWLMLLFVARLKMAAPRPRESKYSETSSPRCNWFKLLFIANLKVTVLRIRKSKHSETSSPRQNDGGLSLLFESESPYEDPFYFNAPSPFFF